MADGSFLPGPCSFPGLCSRRLWGLSPPVADICGKAFVVGCPQVFVPCASVEHSWHFDFLDARELRICARCRPLCRRTKRFCFICLMFIEMLKRLQPKQAFAVPSVLAVDSGTGVPVSGLRGAWSGACLCHCPGTPVPVASFVRVGVSEMESVEQPQGS